MSIPRRTLLSTAGAFAAVGLGLHGVSAGEEKGVKSDQGNDAEEEISAPEDLMREHGVLNRILLIYEEGVRLLQVKERVSANVFRQPAAIVRKFVEDYHEQLEQKFIFPEFEKRQQHVELVKVLRQQHDAGRRLTDTIVRLAAQGELVQAEAVQKLIWTCESFVRMYRPHEAREDTVLFPALYKLVPAAQIKELGEQFEEEEHRLFGEGGFQKTVEQIAEIEKQLGIYDLAAFTPK